MLVMCQETNNDFGNLVAGIVTRGDLVKIQPKGSESLERITNARRSARSTKSAVGSMPFIAQHEVNQTDRDLRIPIAAEVPNTNVTKVEGARQ